MAHVFNLLFSKPPLTPTQLDNLSKDRDYDITEQVKLFNYVPVSLKNGLGRIIKQLHEKN